MALPDSSASIAARVCSISPSRWPRLRPAVGIGSPTRMLNHRRIHQVAASAHRVASALIATGTIGACALIAMMKPPFLNGSRLPVWLRVPSGKIRNELPARIDSRALLDRAHRRFLVAPVDRNEAAEAEGIGARIGILFELVLVEDVQPRMERIEQHRRDRRCFGGCEQNTAPRSTADARPPRPGSGCRTEQRQLHAEMAEDIEQRLPAERQRASACRSDRESERRAKPRHR